MIIEQHYDEEVLIGLLEEADHDSHVPGCETCAGTLESLRDLTSALRDNSVWDERQLSEAPAPKTTNMLRAFAERTKAEDAAAGPIVAKLIAAPAMLEQHPEWKTAGVVRKLLAVVDEKNFSEPKVAADVAALAVEVAESIEPGLYPFDTMMKLRALAWRERGYALAYVGSFPESLAALDRTDECLAACSVSDYDHARSAMYRALIYRELERFNEALALLRDARSVFEKYGDRKRVASAEATQAIVLMGMRRFSEALTIALQISSDAGLDEESRASALHNAAWCYRELSRFGDAKRMYAQAIISFEKLGLVSRRAVSRWGIARVLFDEGRIEDSLVLLTEVRAEFEELGMSEDVATASLHAADALLVLQRPAQVADLCRSAIRYFEKAGLAYSQAAMTALAYLREAAEQGTLNPAKVDQVRNFFKILPKQPNLLFAFSA
jgi:tetratricopeptide (TPR) repeat protein